MTNPYRHNPTQILQATQTTGPEFYVAGGDFWLVCVAHAGGKWVLEFQDPADDTSWIALDVDFTANGAKFWKASSAFKYRITGGIVGARAYYSDVLNRGGITIDF